VASSNIGHNLFPKVLDPIIRLFLELNEEEKNPELLKLKRKVNIKLHDYGFRIFRSIAIITCIIVF